MRLRVLPVLLMFFNLAVMAQAPAGYYDGTAGLYGVQLQAALHGIIDNHTVLTYGNLYNYFAVTDIKPDNSVWDMYSDNPGGTPPYVYHYIASDECGNYSAEGDCFNREHSWPNSWFGGVVLPMYTDLFHMYPTDGYVNNKRGNYPFGNVGTATWTSLNGSKVGNCNWPGYSGTVFEPIDAYKGDFARSYFYMAVRYYTEDAGWPGSPMTIGSQLKPWAISMLLQWSQDDTVSQKEIDRNNQVYQLQHNRNPFIDRPQYAMDIWGPGAGLSEDACTFSVYPCPADKECKLNMPAGCKDKNNDVWLFSSAGQVIRIFHLPAGNSAVIELEDIKPGIYFTRIQSEGKMLPYLGKIVIIHP